jgi:hypothetical protein
MHPFHVAAARGDSESKPSIAPEGLLFKSTPTDSRVFIHVPVRQVKAKDPRELLTASYRNEVSLTGKRKI